MRKYLLIFVLLLGAVSLWGQTAVDYIFIDQSAPNYSQLKNQYNGQQNVFMNENPKPAAYVLTAMLQNRQVVDLHIFVATQAGRLIFNSGTITAENAASFSQFFSQWKGSITGKVVIHGTDIFTTAAGEALKAKLQELTGLDFITP